MHDSMSMYVYLCWAYVCHAYFFRYFMYVPLHAPINVVSVCTLLYLSIMYLCAQQFVHDCVYLYTEPMCFLGIPFGFVPVCDSIYLMYVCVTSMCAHVRAYLCCTMWVHVCTFICFIHLRSCMDLCKLYLWVSIHVTIYVVSSYVRARFILCTPVVRLYVCACM